MRASLVKVCMCALLAGLLVAPGLVAAKHSGKGGDILTTKAWTYALFVNGDNDLERYWEEYSLPALLNIPASTDLNIVAVMDRMSTDGTELIEISGGSWSVVATYPEMNFGDGATFQWFITEINTLYPADNLAVNAWDHGYAWRYFSNDQTSVDRITMPEMRAAILGAGIYIDVLSFDCCNMASVEVVYEASLTGLVGYLVGSEETIPMNGFPYDLMLTPLALEPAKTPAQVAVDMVAGWAQYYDPLSWATTVNLAAIDVTAIGAGTATLQTWSAIVHADLGMYYRAYKNLLKEAYVAWATYYHVDLADLGEAIVADVSIGDAALKTASADLVALIDGAVLAVESGPGAEESHGLTLWWGVRGDWRTYSLAYADVSYATDMGWWAFLDEYN